MISRGFQAGLWAFWGPVLSLVPQLQCIHQALYRFLRHSWLRLVEDPMHPWLISIQRTWEAQLQRILLSVVLFTERERSIKWFCSSYEQSITTSRRRSLSVSLLVWNWAGTDWNIFPITTDKIVIKDKAPIEPKRTLSRNPMSTQHQCSQNKKRMTERDRQTEILEETIPVFSHTAWPTKQQWKMSGPTKYDIYEITG